MWKALSGRSSDKPETSSSSRLNQDDDTVSMKSNRRRVHRSEKSDKSVAGDASSIRDSKKKSSSSAKASSRGDDRDRAFVDESSEVNTNGRSRTNSVSHKSSKSKDKAWEDVDDDKKKRSSRTTESNGEKSHRRRRSRSAERANGDRENGERSLVRRSTDPSNSRNEREPKERTRAAFDAPSSGGAAFAGQFPGQFNAQMPGMPGGSHRIDSDPTSQHSYSNVQQQFPGQFPTETAAPFGRPSQASHEGGIGLAADYYNDNGESVHHQPGARPGTPVIAGTQPHLMAAAHAPNPPQEPSASGGVGANASFFGGEDFGHTPERPPKPGKTSTPGKNSSSGSSSKPSKISKPSKPSKPSKTSGASTALGAAAAGAASSYFMSGAQPHPNTPSTPQQAHLSAGQEVSPRMSPDRPSSYQTANSGPQPNYNQGTSSSHHTNPAYYATAAAAAAAGLAVYEHHQHSQQSHQPSTSQYGISDEYSSKPPPGFHYASDHNHGGYVSAGGGHGNGGNGTGGGHGNGYGNGYGNGQGGTMGTSQQHKHRGPIARLVDFFRDPEGVSRFEEYTEYIGVCQYCFDPRSSARDAPRKHYYGRSRRSWEKMNRSGESLHSRRSYEKFNSSRTSVDRIDKGARYSTSSRKRRESEYESDRKSSGGFMKSAAVATVAGVVGSKLMDRNKSDFQDTYSTRSGHVYDEHKDRRRRGSSSDRDRKGRSVSYGVTSTSRTAERKSERRESKGEVYGFDRDGKPVRRSSIKNTDSITEKKRRSSREREDDGKRTGVKDAIIGAAAGAGIAGTIASRRRSQSPSQRFAGVKRIEKRRDSSSSSASGRTKARRKSSSSRPGILSGLFGGGSSKRKKGKTSSSKKRKEKESSFFGLGNASQSSTDSALIFDDDRRERRTSKKTSAPDKRRKDRSESPRIKSDSDARKAVLALGAGMVALEAAKATKSGYSSDRTRRDGLQGKHHIYEHPDSKIRHASDPEDEIWEDFSDDDSDSVDSALAFDFDERMRRKKSYDSISDASVSDKWSWRWGGRRSRSSSPKLRPREHSHTPTGAKFPSLPFGVSAAAGLSAAVAGYAYENSKQREGSKPIGGTSETPMRMVEPRPVSETGTPSHGPRHVSARPGPVPIQQPQPISPVKKGVYDAQDMPGGFPTDHRDAVAEEEGWRRNGTSRRTTSSPPPRIADLEKAAKRNSRGPDGMRLVQFDFDREQQERHDREEKEEMRSSQILPGVEYIDEKSKTKSKRVSKEEKILREQRREEKALKKDEMSSVRIAELEKEIEATNRKLAELRDGSESERDQRRRLEDVSSTEQPSSKSAFNPAIMAGGAVVASALIGKAIGDRNKDQADGRDERKERKTRKRSDSKREVDREQRFDEIDSKRDSRYSESSDKGRIRRDRQDETTQQYPDDRRYDTRSDVEPKGEIDITKEALASAGLSRITRDVARKVRTRSRSPAEHSSYADFFAPDGITTQPAVDRERSADNVDNNVTVNHADVPDVVTIEPPKGSEIIKRSTSPYSYAPDYFFKPDTSSLDLPWAVPDLKLQRPTPMASPRIGPVDPREDIPEASQSGEQKREHSPPKNKVQFGSNKTHRYEAHTPEEEHNDYVRDAAIAGAAATAVASAVTYAGRKSKDKGRETSSMEGRSTAAYPSPKPSEPETPVDEELSREDIEAEEREWQRNHHVAGDWGDDEDFTAHVAEGLKQTGFDPEIVIQDEDFRKRPSPPGSGDEYSARKKPQSTSRNRDGSFERRRPAVVEEIFGRPDSPGTEGAPPQAGYVEPESLPQTPADELKKTLSRQNTLEEEKQKSSSSSKTSSAVGGKSSNHREPTDLVAASLDDFDDSKLSKKERKKREKEKRKSMEAAAFADPVQTTGQDLDGPPNAQPPVDIEAASSFEKSRELQTSSSGPATVHHGAAQEVVDEQEDLSGLSKKERKKREKEKRQSMTFDVEPTESVDRSEDKLVEPAPVEDEDEWSGLSKKERKKREKEKRQSMTADVEPEEAPAPVSVPVSEPVVDDWEDANLSKKERKKREKENRQSMTVDMEPDTSDAAPATAPVIDAWEDETLSKKEKKKRDKEGRQSLNEIPSEQEPIAETQPANEPADEEWDAGLSKKDRKKLDKQKAAEAALAVGAAAVAADTFVDSPTTYEPVSQINNEEEEEDWSNLSKKERKKREKEKRASLAEQTFKPENTIRVVDDDQAELDIIDAAAREPEISRDDPKSMKKERKSTKDLWEKAIGHNDDEMDFINEFTDDHPAKPSRGFSDIVEAARAGRANDIKSEKARETPSPPQSRDEFFDAEAEAAEDAPTPKRHRSKSRDGASTPSAAGVPLPSESGASTPTFERMARSQELPNVADGYGSDGGYSVAQTAIGTGEDRERRKKKKRHSKHHDDDDDTKSVVSTPGGRDKGRESPKDEKKKGGLFGFLTRKSTDDSSEKRRKEEKEAAETEERKERKKKHRRSRDGQSVYGSDDDSRSVVSRARNSDEDGKLEPRGERRHKHRSSSRHEGGSRDRHRREPSQRSTGFDSQSTIRLVPDDDPDTTKPRDQAEGSQSFLGERPVKTKPPDPTGHEHVTDIALAGAAVAAGTALTAAALHAAEKEPASTDQPVTGLPRNINGAQEESDPSVAAPASPVKTPNHRSTLSIVSDSSKNGASSPTAVPLVFRRPPNSRAGSASSTPAKAPSAPGTPGKKDKDRRPGSTEFKGKADFRPLYLVERHRKPDTTYDPEEELPTLPSSKSTSRASSVHEEDAPQNLPLESPSKKFLGAPIDLESARSFQPTDVLEADQLTPTIASVKAERAKREQDLLDAAMQEHMAGELEWQQRQRKGSELKRPEAAGSSQGNQHPLSTDEIVRSVDVPGPLARPNSPSSTVAQYHKESQPDQFFIPSFKSTDATSDDIPVQPEQTHESKDSHDAEIGLGAAALAGGVAYLATRGSDTHGIQLSPVVEESRDQTRDERATPKPLEELQPEFQDASAAMTNKVGSAHEPELQQDQLALLMAPSADKPQEAATQPIGQDTSKHVDIQEPAPVAQAEDEWGGITTKKAKKAKKGKKGQRSVEIEQADGKSQFEEPAIPGEAADLTEDPTVSNEEQPQQVELGNSPETSSEQTFATTDAASADRDSGFAVKKGKKEKKGKKSKGASFSETSNIDLSAEQAATDSLKDAKEVSEGVETAAMTAAIGAGLSREPETTKDSSEPIPLTEKDPLPSDTRPETVLDKDVDSINVSNPVTAGEEWAEAAPKSGKKAKKAKKGKKGKAAESTDKGHELEITDPVEPADTAEPSLDKAINGEVEASTVPLPMDADLDLAEPVVKPTEAEPSAVFDMNVPSTIPLPVDEDDALADEFHDSQEMQPEPGNLLSKDGSGAATTTYPIEEAKLEPMATEDDLWSSSTPKKDKKAKKNKRKSLLSEEPEEPLQAQEHATAKSLEHVQQNTETGSQPHSSQDDSAAIVPPAPAASTSSDRAIEESSAVSAIAAVESQPEPSETANEYSSAPSTRKSKKDKKKKRQSLLADEDVTEDQLPAPGPQLAENQPEHVLEPSSDQPPQPEQMPDAGGITGFTGSNAPLPNTETINRDVEVEELAFGSEPIENAPGGAEETNEFDLAASKKDKKKSKKEKKKKQRESVVEEDPAISATATAQDPVTIDSRPEAEQEHVVKEPENVAAIKEVRPIEVGLESSKEVGEEIPVATEPEVEFEWSVEPPGGKKAKKDKKKKKRQSQTDEPQSLPTEEPQVEERDSLEQPLATSEAELGAETAIQTSQPSFEPSSSGVTQAEAELIMPLPTDDVSQDQTPRELISEPTETIEFHPVRQDLTGDNSATSLNTRAEIREKTTDELVRDINATGSDQSVEATAEQLTADLPELTTSIDKAAEAVDTTAVKPEDDEWAFPTKTKKGKKGKKGQAKAADLEPELEAPTSESADQNFGDEIAVASASLAAGAVFGASPSQDKALDNTDNKLSSEGEFKETQENAEDDWGFKSKKKKGKKARKDETPTEYPAAVSEPEHAPATAPSDAVVASRDVLDLVAGNDETAKPLEDETEPANVQDEWGEGFGSTKTKKPKKGKKGKRASVVEEESLGQQTEIPETDSVTVKDNVDLPDALATAIQAEPSLEDWSVDRQIGVAREEQRQGTGSDVHTAAKDTPLEAQAHNTEFQTLNDTAPKQDLAEHDTIEDKAPTATPVDDKTEPVEAEEEPSLPSNTKKSKKKGKKSKRVSMIEDEFPDSNAEFDRDSMATDTRSSAVEPIVGSQDEQQTLVDTDKAVPIVDAEVDGSAPSSSSKKSKKNKKGKRVSVVEDEFPDANVELDREPLHVGTIDTEAEPTDVGQNGDQSMVDAGSTESAIDADDLWSSPTTSKKSKKSKNKGKRGSVAEEELLVTSESNQAEREEASAVQTSQPEANETPVPVQAVNEGLVQPDEMPEDSTSKEKQTKTEVNDELVLTESKSKKKGKKGKRGSFIESQPPELPEASVEPSNEQNKDVPVDDGESSTAGQEETPKEPEVEEDWGLTESKKSKKKGKKAKRASVAFDELINEPSQPPIPVSEDAETREAEASDDSPGATGLTGPSPSLEEAVAFRPEDEFAPLTRTGSKKNKRVSWPAESELVVEHEISAPPSGIATPAELNISIPDVAKDLPPGTTSDQIPSPSWDTSPMETRNEDDAWGFRKKERRGSQSDSDSGSPELERSVDNSNDAVVEENVEDWGATFGSKKKNKGKKAKPMDDFAEDPKLDLDSTAANKGLGISEETVIQSQIGEAEQDDELDGLFTSKKSKKNKKKKGKGKATEDTLIEPATSNETPAIFEELVPQTATSSEENASEQSSAKNISSEDPLKDAKCTEKALHDIETVPGSWLTEEDTSVAQPALESPSPADQDISNSQAERTDVDEEWSLPAPSKGKKGKKGKKSKSITEVEPEVAYTESSPIEQAVSMEAENSIEGGLSSREPPLENSPEADNANGKSLAPEVTVDLRNLHETEARSDATVPNAETEAQAEDEFAFVAPKKGKKGKKSKKGKTVTADEPEPEPAPERSKALDESISMEGSSEQTSAMEGVIAHEVPVKEPRFTEASVFQQASTDLTSAQSNTDQMDFEHTSTVEESLQKPEGPHDEVLASEELPRDLPTTAGVEPETSWNALEDPPKSENETVKRPIGDGSENGDAQTLQDAFAAGAIGAAAAAAVHELEQSQQSSADPAGSIADPDDDWGAPVTKKGKKSKSKKAKAAEQYSEPSQSHLDLSQDLSEPTAPASTQLPQEPAAVPPTTTLPPDDTFEFPTSKKGKKAKKTKKSDKNQESRELDTSEARPQQEREIGAGTETNVTAERVDAEQYAAPLREGRLTEPENQPFVQTGSDVLEETSSADPSTINATAVSDRTVGDAGSKSAWATKPVDVFPTEPATIDDQFRERQSKAAGPADSTKAANEDTFAEAPSRKKSKGKKNKKDKAEVVTQPESGAEQDVEPDRSLENVEPVVQQADDILSKPAETEPDIFQDAPSRKKSKGKKNKKDKGTAFSWDTAEPQSTESTNLSLGQPTGATPGNWDQADTSALATRDLMSESSNARQSPSHEGARERMEQDLSLPEENPPQWSFGRSETAEPSTENDNAAASFDELTRKSSKTKGADVAARMAMFETGEPGRGLHRSETVKKKHGHHHEEQADAARDISMTDKHSYDIGTRTPQRLSTASPELPSLVEQRYMTPARDTERAPSPVDSTSKERSSATLFSSSPSIRDTPTHTRHRPHRSIEEVSRAEDYRSLHSPPATPVHDGRVGTPLMTVTEQSPEEQAARRRMREEADYGQPESALKNFKRRSAYGLAEHRAYSRSPLPEHDRARRLGHISGDDLHGKYEAEGLESSGSARRSFGRPSRPRSIVASGEVDPSYRPFSGASVRSNDSISAYIREERPTSVSPSLRHEKRSVSSDLRRAAMETTPSKEQGRDMGSEHASERGQDGMETKHEGMGTEELAALGLAGAGLAATAAGFAGPSTYDPTTDKGKGRITRMNDVYEAWGEQPGSPRSPSRPQSVRRRQSMQILDLEGRLESLVSENRLLQDSKAKAERQLESTSQEHSSSLLAQQEATKTRDLYLSQKDQELEALRNVLNSLQGEVARLTEANRELTESKAGEGDVAERYRLLQAEHANTRSLHEDSTRELNDIRDKHSSMSRGMEALVAGEVASAIAGKDSELRELRSELQAAQERIRALQQQISASRNVSDKDDILISRDEDYFDTKCQQLCQHVQQWVLRFSKFSDMKKCRSVAEIRDEKVVDRFENVILDDTEVDELLSDRVRRRDVFTSVVMTMIFEFVFTRYLFGMDREQRQKLKALEKTLTEVGPAAAINKWRATTLTLLTRRKQFRAQREQDTQAVVQEIYDSLAIFLPPPAQLVSQITSSLTKVLNLAVDLHIEMRTQRAEYAMLPPLQPEYDTNGELAHTIPFRSDLMNERSGKFEDNAEVPDGSVVRIVLFPLVVKRGDEDGQGDEEEVVCPAQVLIARDDDRRGKRGISEMPDAMKSKMSIAPSTFGGPSEGGMF